MAPKSELKTVVLCYRFDRGLVQDQRSMELDTASNTAHNSQSHRTWYLSLPSAAGARLLTSFLTHDLE